MRVLIKLVNKGYYITFMLPTYANDDYHYWLQIQILRKKKNTLRPMSIHLTICDERILHATSISSITICNVIWSNGIVSNKRTGERIIIRSFSSSIRSDTHGQITEARARFQLAKTYRLERCFPRTINSLIKQTKMFEISTFGSRKAKVTKVVL